MDFGYGKKKKKSSCNSSRNVRNYSLCRRKKIIGASEDTPAPLSAPKSNGGLPMVCMGHSL